MTRLMDISVLVIPVTKGYIAMVNELLCFLCLLIMISGFICIQFIILKLRNRGIVQGIEKFDSNH